MNTINVNWFSVSISTETYRRIAKVAESRRLDFNGAVALCLEKSAGNAPKLRGEKK